MNMGYYFRRVGTSWPPAQPSQWQRVAIPRPYHTNSGLEQDVRFETFRPGNTLRRIISPFVRVRLAEQWTNGPHPTTKQGVMPSRIA